MARSILIENGLNDSRNYAGSRKSRPMPFRWNSSFPVVKGVKNKVKKITGALFTLIHGAFIIFFNHTFSIIIFAQERGRSSV